MKLIKQILIVITFLYLSGFLLQFIFSLVKVTTAKNSLISDYYDSWTAVYYISAMFFIKRVIPLLPLLVGTYYLIKLLLQKRLSKAVVIGINVLLYVCYGFAVFGNQFWHIKIFTRSFESPLLAFIKFENRDLYFSLTSLMGFLMFTFMSYRFWKVKLINHPGQESPV
jgi:hypothetical protein